MILSQLYPLGIPPSHAFLPHETIDITIDICSHFVASLLLLKIAAANALPLRL